MTCLLNALLSSSHDSDPSSEHHGQSLLSRLQKVIQKVYGRAVNHFISSMDTSLWKLNGTYSRKVTLPAFGYLSVQIDIRRIRLKGSNMIQALLPVFLSGYRSVPSSHLLQIVEWASIHGVRSAADRFLTAESSIRKYLADFRSSPFRDLQLSGLSIRELARTCIQSASLHFLQPARTFKSRDVISYWDQTPPVDPMPQGHSDT